jgi:hypothetical protein
VKPKRERGRSRSRATSKNIKLAELLKFVALEGNEERQLAYITALRLREGNYDLDPILNGLPKANISRFLQLVVDAMEGKPSKFDLTVTGDKMVKAWIAVNGVGATDGLLGTLREVKTKYALAVGYKPPKNRAEIPSWLADLEGRKKIPDDWTFRKTFDRLHLPYAKDKRGASRK